MREDFDFVPSAPVRFEMLERFPGTRYLFVSDDETRLIQLQPDRFAHNWRKARDGDSYPRYDTIAAEFKERYAGVVLRVPETVLPSWAEVTYVNHIETDPPEAAHREPARVLSFFTGIPLPGAEDEFEDLQVQQRFRIRAAGEVCGRLHVQGSAAFRNVDATPILVLTLTARVRVRGEGAEAVYAALDIGHERVVNGFTAITTREMQTHWGRER